MNYYNEDEIEKSIMNKVDHNRLIQMNNKINNKMNEGCIKFDKFYFNSFHNDKNYFTIINYQVNEEQHKNYMDKINNAFEEFSRITKFKSQLVNHQGYKLICSIQHQWEKYGNISEKQLRVLKINGFLNINLSDSYSYLEYIEYIDQKKEGRKIIIKNLLNSRINIYLTNIIEKLL